jgi:hypothetical protein
MGEHYIPQYYLSGFCDPSAPSKIWVYEKGNERIFLSGIKNIAHENNRWPQKTEEYFANSIEAPANHVLDKIRNRELISQSDKVTLSDYMIILWKRVPRGFERSKAIYPEVMNEVFANIEQKMYALIEKYPSKKELLQERLQELPKLKLEYEKELPKELWYQTLSPDALPMVRTVLPAMTWVFFTSDNRQPLLTSDNPVFFFEWYGLGKPKSEITFPISSEIVLWATWRSGIVENQYAAIKDSILNEINRRTASSATKYMYYSIEANWVVNLINKNNWKLHSIG